MLELINSFPDFKGSFGDKRSEKRAGQVLSNLTIGKSSSLRQNSRNEDEQKSFYRLLSNESFSEQSIDKGILARCGGLYKNRDVLCIQDSAEFNLTGQRGHSKPQTGPDQP
jgi:hypothetical protein